MWINGSYVDWWTEHSGREYDKKRDCFFDYFQGMELGPFLINGQNKTVGILYAFKFIPDYHLILKTTGVFLTSKVHTCTCILLLLCGMVFYSYCPHNYSQEILYTL